MKFSIFFMLAASITLGAAASGMSRNQLVLTPILVTYHLVQIY